MKTWKRRILIAGLVLTVLFIVACGGGAAATQVPATEVPPATEKVEPTTAPTEAPAEEVAITIPEDNGQISLKYVIVADGVVTLQYIDNAENCTTMFDSDNVKPISMDMFCLPTGNDPMWVTGFPVNVFDNIQVGMNVVLCDWPITCSEPTTISGDTSVIPTEGVLEVEVEVINADTNTSESNPEEGLRKGDALPPISLPDLFTGETRTFDNLNLKGPVFINLWASWCGYCREEFPEILAAATNPDYQNATFIFIGDGGESAQDQKDFLAKYGDLPSNMIFLYDMNSDYEYWTGGGWPQSYFTNDGVIIYVIAGSLAGVDGWESLLVP